MRVANLIHHGRRPGQRRRHFIALDDRAYRIHTELAHARRELAQRGSGHRARGAAATHSTRRRRRARRRVLAGVQHLPSQLRLVRLYTTKHWYIKPLIEPIERSQRDVQRLFRRARVRRRPRRHPRQPSHDPSSHELDVIRHRAPHDRVIIASRARRAPRRRHRVDARARRARARAFVLIRLLPREPRVDARAPIVLAHALVPQSASASQRARARVLVRANVRVDDVLVDDVFVFVRAFRPLARARARERPSQRPRRVDERVSRARFDARVERGRAVAAVALRRDARRLH